jgi:hypothetical protein
MIHTYLDQEINLELDDKRKFQIRPTKKEILLEPFRDPEHSAAKFVAEIARIPLLRQFLFLEQISANSLDNPAKVTITYPICFQPDSDIHTRLEDINYDSKLRSLDDKYNAYLNEFANIVNGYYLRIFNLPEHVQKLIREKGFLDALSDSADELQLRSELESTFISFFRSWRHLMEMDRFINDIHISKAAIKNSISINQTVSIPEKMQQILDELSILSKHVYLATNSTCLDCYFVYNDYPPFVSTTSSVKNMSSMRQERTNSYNFMGLSGIHK